MSRPTVASAKPKPKRNMEAVYLKALRDIADVDCDTDQHRAYIGGLWRSGFADGCKCRTCIARRALLEFDGAT